MTADPIVDRNRPTKPPINPLSVLPFDKTAISESPNIASQKYSTGPKLKATVANGGATIKSASAPTIPPKADAKQEIVTARSPSPRFAMGKPSSDVAMAAGVPGVFTRIAAYAPP